MLPVNHQVPLKTITHKNHSVSSATKDITDEQLQTMDSPKRINSLQWELSTPQERRELLAGSNDKQSVTDEIPQQSVTTESVNISSTIPAIVKDKTIIAKTAGYPGTLLEQQAQTQLYNSLNSLQPFNKKVPILLNADLPTKASQNSVKEALQNNQDQVALDETIQKFQQLFTSTAQNKAIFHALVKNAFGGQYDVNKAEVLRQQALNGDFNWVPKIQLVNESQLKDISQTQGSGVGRGAYSQSTDTIYLSRELLRSDPALAAKILAEEMGHAIDTKINITDAKGDEGEIFSRLVNGEDISATELAALQQENDSGMININGEKIEVEYGFPGRLNKDRKELSEQFEVLEQKISNAKEKITSLLAEGKYAAAAQQIEVLVLKTKELGTTDFSELTQFLTHMEHLGTQIEAGAWEDMLQTLKDMNKNVIGLNGVDSIFSEIVEDLIADYKTIVKSIKHMYTPSISAGKYISIVEVFKQGNYDLAANMMNEMAVAMGRDSNPVLYDALISRAEAIRPITNVWTEFSHGYADEGLIGELMATANSFEEVAQKLVVLLDSMSDSEYKVFINDFRHSRMFQAVMDSRQTYTPTGSNNGGPLRVRKKDAIFDLLAARGISIVQSDAWYATNLGMILSNLDGYTNSIFTYEQIEGFGELAQIQGYESIAKTIFAEFNGMSVPVKLRRTRRFGGRITLLLPAMWQHKNDLSVQWNKTRENPEARRELVQKWVEQGAADAIGKILKVNLAEYIPAEGPMAAGTIKSNMTVIKEELAEVDDLLNTLVHQRNVESAALRANLVRSFGEEKVAEMEQSLSAKYGDKTDDELDQSITNVQKELGSILAGYNGLDNVLYIHTILTKLFDEKYKRLQQSRTDIGSTVSEINENVKNGAASLPSLAEISNLRLEIVELNEQVYATGALYKNGMSGRATNEELKAASEAVKTTSTNLQSAMEQAKLALGDDLGPDWMTKENPQLFAAAIKAKESLRELRQMLKGLILDGVSAETEVGLEQSIDALNKSIGGIQQIIDVQRMGAATAKWIDQYSADYAVDMLGKVGGFDFSSIGMDKPIPLQQAQSALMTSIENLKTVLANPDSSLAEKTDAMTIVRSKSMKLKNELQEFKGMLPAGGAHAKVIDGFIGSLDGFIAQMKPGDQSVTADDVKNTVAAKLKSLADTDPQALRALLSKIFNVKDQAKLDTVIENIKSGSTDWMPEIIISDNKTMQGNYAAYSAAEDVIYLNAAVLKLPQQAFAVLLEEVGHSIDVDLNGEVDTQGDEGELFRRLLSGEKLKASQIQEIRNDNDYATLNIDGVDVTVELCFFGDAARAIIGAVESFVDAVVDVVKEIADFVADVLDGIGEMIEALGDGLVKLVQTDAFKILSLGLQVFFPGSYPALMAIYAAAGASVHMGLKTGDMRLVLQGLAQAALATGEFGGDLFGLSEQTVSTINTIGKSIDFGLRLDAAIKTGDILGFLIDEIDALPDDSKFADLKKFVKPLELTVAYSNAGSDAERAAAILGFVGFVGEGTEVGDIAAQLGSKTELVINIDKAIKAKDWATAQALVMGFLKNDTNLSEEKLATVGTVLYIGSSVADGIEAVESQEWADVVRAIGNVSLGVSQLVDPNDLQGQADLLEEFEKAAKVIEGIDVLAQIVEGDLDISDAAGKLISLYEKDFPGLAEAIGKIKDATDLVSLISNLDGDVEVVVGAMLVLVTAFGGDSDLMTTEQLNKLLAAGKKLQENWSSGNYSAAAESFKELGRILIDGTGFEQYQQKIDDFADNWIAPIGYSKDLWDAVKNQDVDGIIASALKIGSLTGSATRIKELQEAAELLSSSWNSGDYEKATEALKTLGKVVTERTAFAKYQPEIDDFADNWIQPLGYSRDLKNAIEGDDVQFDKVKEIIGKLATLNGDVDGELLKVINSADKLVKAWEDGEYTEAATQFKHFAGLLAGGSGLLPELIDSDVIAFADKWIVRLGYARDLNSAVEDGNVDGALAAITKLATLGGYDGVEDIVLKAQEFETAWNAGDYEKAMELFKELVPLLTEGTWLESHNQTIIDFALERLIPIGFAVKLYDMISSGRIDEAKAMIKTVAAGKGEQFVVETLNKLVTLEDHWNAGEYVKAAGVFKDISSDIMPEEMYNAHGKKIEEFSDRWIVRFGYTRDLKNELEKDNVDVEKVKVIINKLATEFGDTSGDTAALIESAEKLVKAWEGRDYNEATREFKVLAGFLVAGTGFSSDSFNKTVTDFADKWIVRFGYARDLNDAVEDENVDAALAAITGLATLAGYAGVEDIIEKAQEFETAWNAGDYEKALDVFKEIVPLLTEGTWLETYNQIIIDFAIERLVPIGFAVKLYDMISSGRVDEAKAMIKTVAEGKADQPVVETINKLVTLEGHWNAGEYVEAADVFEDIISDLMPAEMYKNYGDKVEEFADKWIVRLGYARDLKSAVEREDFAKVIAILVDIAGLGVYSEVSPEIDTSTKKLIEHWNKREYKAAADEFKNLDKLMLKEITGMDLGNTLLVEFANKWIITLGFARDVNKAIKAEDRDAVLAAIATVTGQDGTDDGFAELKELSVKFEKLWKEGEHEEALKVLKQLTSLLQSVTGFEFSDISEFFKLPDNSQLPDDSQVQLAAVGG